jgi:co-chaperonin GroES (HSP10)
MRNVIHLKNTVIPTQNKVLVRIEDTYDIKKTDSGIWLPNAAHFEAEADSTGHNLSEFIIRTGVVEKMPRKLYRGNWDWYPNEDEIKEGDQVYWPIVRFFEYTVVKTDDGGLYILVDFHDIHMKKVNGKPIPVNGFYLFEQVISERKVFEHIIK